MEVILQHAAPEIAAAPANAMNDDGRHKIRPTAAIVFRISADDDFIFTLIIGPHVLDQFIDNLLGREFNPNGAVEIIGFHNLVQS